MVDAKTKKILIWTVIVAVVVLSAYFIKRGMDGPGKYDSFAKCLTEKGARMYGTEWCSHCQAQKALFGKSFQYVFFTDCDLDTATCSRNNITGYPTWIINGTQYQGRQTLQNLGFLTDCESLLLQ
jgi:hypothetical protein